MRFQRGVMRFGQGLHCRLQCCRCHMVWWLVNQITAKINPAHLANQTVGMNAIWQGQVIDRRRRGASIGVKLILPKPPSKREAFQQASVKIIRCGGKLPMAFWQAGRQGSAIPNSMIAKNANGEINAPISGGKIDRFTGFGVKILRADPALMRVTGLGLPNGKIIRCHQVNFGSR